jgi:spore coat polysaccharide biosynthesis protein SpsF
MKVVAVVQARMGSTRLPGKMMLPLGGKSAITHVLQRTDRATLVDETILATTSKERDELLQNRAHELGIETYRGDEEDVLGRVLSAAKVADADVIVRIAGDCPLVSPTIKHY